MTVNEFQLLYKLFCDELSDMEDLLETAQDALNDARAGMIALDRFKCQWCRCIKEFPEGEEP